MAILVRSQSSSSASERQFSVLAQQAIGSAAALLLHLTSQPQWCWTAVRDRVLLFLLPLLLTGCGNWPSVSISSTALLQILVPFLSTWNSCSVSYVYKHRQCLQRLRKTNNDKDRAPSTGWEERISFQLLSILVNAGHVWDTDPGRGHSDDGHESVKCGSRGLAYKMWTLLD